jgi:hypothetical protein
MKKRTAVAMIAMSIAMIASTGIARAENIIYVSGPAEQFRGYTIPVLVLPQGTTGTYLNLDIALHNFQSDGVFGPDRAWCAAAEFPAGKCPLFWSVDVGATAQKPIYGLEDAAPGTYTFKCAHHPAQKGTLVII